jgi:hypothetical protein
VQEWWEDGEMVKPCCGLLTSIPRFVKAGYRDCCNGTVVIVVIIVIILVV